MRKDAVALVLHGEVTPETCEQAGGHLLNLMREMTREVAGDPDAVTWTLGEWQRQCDGCEVQVPMTDTLPPGWVRAGIDDFCKPCALARLAV